MTTLTFISVSYTHLIFGALFVVAVLVLAVLSSTVRSKVSLADERKYEELPQQENIYLSCLLYTSV